MVVFGVGARVVTELRERLRERPTPACAGVERGRSVVWVEPRPSPRCSAFLTQELERTRMKVPGGGKTS